MRQQHRSSSTRCADPVRAQDEAVQLTGGPGVGSAAAALELLAGHCAVAAVTLGACGCLVRGRGGAAFLEPAVENVAVVDATGERSRALTSNQSARECRALLLSPALGRFPVSCSGSRGSFTHTLPASHAPVELTGLQAVCLPCNN